MACVLGYLSTREAVPDLGRSKKPSHQILVDIVAKHAEGDVIALWNQGGEFESRDIEQENMHRRSESLLDNIAAQVEFADKRLRPIWPRKP